MLKKIIILWLLMCAKVFGQALPHNIGFEDGSLNGWNCRAGTIDTVTGFKLSDSQQLMDRHTVLSKQANGNQLDPYGNFPVVCPNGSNYSVKLGNAEVNSQAESVYYTFMVLPDANLGYSITFNYAVVFQDPDHTAKEQPRFTARVYDIAADKYVSCPYLEFKAGSALPGFVLSTTKAATASGSAREAAIYYKDWSSATIDLSDYVGRLMRIEFITNDCTRGGHFGYAYLDVDESKSAAPIEGNKYCPGQTPIILKGPPGYSGYRWLSGDGKQEITQSQNLVLDVTPPDLTRYALEVTPYPGAGCPGIFKTEVVRIADEFKLVTHEVSGCPEIGADLTASAVTEGSTPGLTYSYFTDASLRVHIPDSTHVPLSGTYYILGAAKSGCKDAVPVKVNLISFNVNISDPVPVRYPETVDLSKSFIADPNFTYSYFTDQDATIPLVNYKAVDKSGEYFIRIKNGFGCQIIKIVHVQVLPPLPFVADAPNVFTPNNDGINDKFSLHLDGFIKFNSMDIFNRNGQLMFTTKSSIDQWDGNFKGRPLPTGTYYWIFNGLDTYYNVSVRRNGYVSIIR